MSKWWWSVLVTSFYRWSLTRRNACTGLPRAHCVACHFPTLKSLRRDNSGAWHNINESAESNQARICKTRCCEDLDQTLNRERRFIWIWPQKDGGLCWTWINKQLTRLVQASTHAYVFIFSCPAFFPEEWKSLRPGFVLDSDAWMNQESCNWIVVCLMHIRQLD